MEEVESNGCAALFLYVLGAMFLWMIVTSPDEHVHIPRWVGIVMGLGFVAGGLGSTLSKYETISRYLGLLFFIGFLFPFHWLLFTKPNPFLLLIVGSIDYKIGIHFVRKMRTASLKKRIEDAN